MISDGTTSPSAVAASGWGTSISAPEVHSSAGSSTGVLCWPRRLTLQIWTYVAQAETGFEIAKTARVELPPARYCGAVAGGSIASLIPTEWLQLVAAVGFLIIGSQLLLRRNSEGSAEDDLVDS